MQNEIQVHKDLFFSNHYYPGLDRNVLSVTPTEKYVWSFPVLNPVSLQKQIHNHITGLANPKEKLTEYIKDWINWYTNNRD